MANLEAGLALVTCTLSIRPDLLALAPVALLLLQHPLPALPHHPMPRSPLWAPVEVGLLVSCCLWGRQGATLGQLLGQHRPESAHESLALSKES